MRRFVPMPAIVNKSRKHQLKRTKTVKYSFVQRQMMVFLFGFQIVLVVDLIAMELLCCMTATILQSFWCQFWFGLQPFWFGISFSCQHPGCPAKTSGTDSSEHFLSLVDLLKHLGVERRLLVDRLQENELPWSMHVHFLAEKCWIWNIWKEPAVV